MSSIIEGYNYDIFISYRQKDNKHDGWVTNFVNNLKGELESTFKEEISVYFDVNPRDGLLETHDVDESLKNKLKCLVFIPVISRTYCDPKSFAWEHELKVFLNLAASDPFGIMVKLPGGNVASRILPVRIHDLAPEDVILFEQVLGRHLRGVEFIYREPGVNKPLTPEDDDKKNLNRTKYRIQINRTANAISELISGLMTASHGIPPVEVMEGIEKVTDADPGPGPVKKKWRFHLFSFLLLGIALFSIFLFSGGTNLPFNRRDWILITDFENHTGNTIFDKSLYTAFSLSASQSRYVNVFPRSRMIESLKRMNADVNGNVDEKTGREMAIREGISLFIAPGISQAGNKYAITAKIIEAASGNVLQSVVIFADSHEEILPGLDALSRKIRHILGESRYRISLQDKPLAKVTTSSIEALKVYSIGIEHHINLEFGKARESYEAALKIDTGFVAAKASLGNIIFERFDASKGKAILSEAVKGVDRLTEREKFSILAFHAAAVEKDFHKAIEYARARINLYPDDMAGHNNLGWYYQNIRYFAEAAKEYKEVLRIDPGFVVSHTGLIWVYFELGQLDSAIVWAEKMVERHPRNPWGYAYIGSALSGLDSLKAAIPYYQKALELDPDLAYNLYRYGHTCRLMGDYEKAIKLISLILEKNKDDLAAYCDLGVLYSRMGNKVDAERFFRKFEEEASGRWLTDYPDHYGTYTSLAVVAAYLGEMDRSRELLEKAISIDSTQHFQFASVLCAQDRLPEAIHELDLAFRNGYRNIAWIKVHPNLEVLKYDIRFHNLLKKYFR